jgi:hypothetical protein
VDEEDGAEVFVNGDCAYLEVKEIRRLQEFLNTQFHLETPEDSVKTRVAEFAHKAEIKQVSKRLKVYQGLNDRNPIA